MAQMQNKQLTIASWNADGLKEKLYTETSFLSVYESKQFIIDHKINIMINETNFNQKTDLNFQGFKCYRKDQSPSATSGGVLILVSNHIDSQEICIVSNLIKAVEAKIGNYIIVEAYLRVCKNPERSASDGRLECQT